MLCKSVPELVPTKNYCVTFTEHEAKVIFDIVGSVRGVGPGRVVTDRLYDLLQMHGIEKDDCGTGEFFSGNLTSLGDA